MSSAAKPAGNAMRIPMLVGLVAGLVAGAFGQSIPGGLGVGFGVFLIAGMARWMQVRLRIGQVEPVQSLFLARAFPRSTWGFVIAHLGFAVAVVPKANTPKKPIEGLTIHAVERIEQAIEAVRGLT